MTAATEAHRRVNQSARLLAGLVSFSTMIVLSLLGLMETVRNFGYLYRMWRWMFLFSPALYVYCLASLNAVYLPISGIGFLKKGIALMRDSLATGIATVAGTVLAVVTASYVCQLLAWGSLPLTREASGDLYVRMIPFIPWPDYPFHW